MSQWILGPRHNCASPEDDNWGGRLGAMTARKTIGLIVRVAVSVALLAFILSLLDLAALREILPRAHLSWIAGTLLVHVVLRFIMALRWQIILRSYGIHMPFGEISWVTFVSGSLGVIVPGGLGSDLFRGIHVVRKHGSLGKVTSSILIDRFIGIYSVIVIGTIAALVAVGLRVEPDFLITFVVFQLVVIGAWTLGTWLSGHAHRLAFSSRRLQWMWSGLVQVARNMTDLGVLREIFAAIFASSIAVNLGRCLVMYLLYRAFGVELNPLYFLIFVPLVFLATQIPISISGLGITEGMLILLFEPLGVPREVSFAVGIVSYGVQLALSAGVLAIWLTAALVGYFAPETNARKTGPS